MSPKSRPQEFHVMEFAHHDEGAAFVAALSRFLDSPKANISFVGTASPRGRSEVEVWARSAVRAEGVRLFLSDKALEAARSVFSPIHTSKTVSRESLPDDSFLIIEGGVTPAWGATEASARLSPP